eukprot:GHVL01035236.1.p1 GENE.GHVL01035236.1~~GHVL01035236.1.p1  ORF type:complete len:907 (+),score=177.92 GHVL01035236.1:160-2721(+)
MLEKCNIDENILDILNIFAQNLSQNERCNERRIILSQRLIAHLLSIPAVCRFSNSKLLETVTRLLTISKDHRPNDDLLDKSSEKDRKGVWIMCNLCDILSSLCNIKIHNQTPTNNLTPTSNQTQLVSLFVPMICWARSLIDIKTFVRLIHPNSSQRSIDENFTLAQDQIKVLLHRSMIDILLKYANNHSIICILEIYIPKMKEVAETDIKTEKLDIEDRRLPRFLVEEMEEEIKENHESYECCEMAALLQDPSSLMLNALSFSGDLVNRLFDYIYNIWLYLESESNSVNRNNIDLIWQNFGDIKRASSDVALCVTFLCALYNHQLRVMHDVEFIGGNATGNMLSLDKIIFLSIFLNQIGFKLVKTLVSDKKDISDEIFRNPPGSIGSFICTLVHSLYSRNVRQRFLSTNNIPQGFKHPTYELSLDTDEIPWLVNDELLLKHDDLTDVNSSRIRDGILTEMPQCLSFQRRLLIFKQWRETERQQLTGRASPVFYDLVVHDIRRDFIVEDGMDMIRQKSVEDLKKSFKIRFVGPEGIPESGVDGGGLMREFLILLTRKAFNPEYGLFMETPDRALYPSPSAHIAHPDPQNAYHWLGRILGLSIYEGNLVEARFCQILLNSMLGRINQIDDVPSLDPELHKNLMFIKHYQGDVQDLGLFFSVTLNDLEGGLEIDLEPNGRNIPVTNSNKERYLYRMAFFKVNKQFEWQTLAFVQGVSCLIPMDKLAMFNQSELQMIISGDPSGFDVSDLCSNLNLGGGYDTDSVTVKMLWDLLRDWSSSDRGEFLMFVTACSRPPILGFKDLHPTFCIHRVDDCSRLPTASTCANILKLPDYKDRQILEKKLRISIQNNAGGFHLS